jgi:hypothetical protein
MIRMPTSAVKEVEVLIISYECELNLNPFNLHFRNKGDNSSRRSNCTPEPDFYVKVEVDLTDSSLSLLWFMRKAMRSGAQRRL